MPRRDQKPVMPVTQNYQAVLSSAQPSSILSLNSSVLACQPLDPHTFPEQDPDVLALYTNWSSSPTIPPIYDPSETTPLDRRSIWANKAPAAWLLARQLRDQAFERYALAQLIRHCGTSLFGPWAFIEARCPVGSSIRRFTNHWVAWNASFCPVGPNSEYTGLYATTLVNKIVRNETHDPRPFDLDHWFQSCGDEFVTKCNHDPVVRRAKERERLRPKTQEPSAVGMAEELGIDTSGWAWRIANASAKLGSRISSRKRWKPLRWFFGFLIPFLLANPLGTTMVRVHLRLQRNKSCITNSYQSSSCLASTFPLLRFSRAHRSTTVSRSQGSAQTTSGSLWRWRLRALASLHWLLYPGTAYISGGGASSTSTSAFSTSGLLGMEFPGLWI